MKILLPFLILTVLFTACTSDNNEVPESITQFAQEAIDASININPDRNLPADTRILDPFIASYFHKDVSEEYTRKLANNAIIWDGMSHETTLRHATLISSHQGNADYLLKYWVQFGDTRKFSYLIQVAEYEGKMSLKRFEPMDINLSGTVFAPDSSIPNPHFYSNIAFIAFTYVSVIGTLLLLAWMIIRKRHRMLLIGIPLSFIYYQGAYIFDYQGFSKSSGLHIGLPLFADMDLYLTNLTLIPVGVLAFWAFVGVYALVKPFRTKPMIQTETRPGFS